MMFKCRTFSKKGLTNEQLIFFVFIYDYTKPSKIGNTKRYNITNPMFSNMLKLSSSNISGRKYAIKGKAMSRFQELYIKNLNTFEAPFLSYTGINSDLIENIIIPGTIKNNKHNQ